MATLPPSDPRQAEAVRLTRLLLPTYLGLCALLFLPAITRVVGFAIVPGSIQPYLSAVSLLAMIVVLGLWFGRLSSLEAWKIGGGPRFSLIAAMMEGVWVDVGGGAPPSTSRVAAVSPLGVLATDVDDCARTLAGSGRVAAGEAARAALREAEALALAMDTYERGAPAEQLGRARAAIASFEDHVQQLRKAPEGEDAAVRARFEADLQGLRAAGDALRAGLTSTGNVA